MFQCRSISNSFKNSVKNFVNILSGRHSTVLRLVTKSIVCLQIKLWSLNIDNVIMEIKYRSNSDPQTFGILTNFNSLGITFFQSLNPAIVIGYNYIIVNHL